MISVLIADDHVVVRAGLRQLIEAAEGMTVSAEAGTGPEAIEKVLTADHDVVLLDISMPGASGTEILKRIKEAKPKTAILVLSMYPEEQYATRMLKAGAAGYLNKQCVPEELIRAIRKVADGRKYISSTVAEVLAADVSGDVEQAAHQELSDREYEVMILIARGKTTAEIADLLNLSPKTVGTYRARIFEKSGLHNNNEIMRYALKHGLVD
jgi:DNA-binding NarL/FixJ family response regulator